MNKVDAAYEFMSSRICLTVLEGERLSGILKLADYKLRTGRIKEQDVTPATSLIEKYVEKSRSDYSDFINSIAEPSVEIIGYLAMLKVQEIGYIREIYTSSDTFKMSEIVNNLA